MSLSVRLVTALPSVPFVLGPIILQGVPGDEGQKEALPRGKVRVTPGSMHQVTGHKGGPPLGKSHSNVMLKSPE